MGKMADIDEMMYSCGLDIVHPGGIEKTDEMTRMCKIGRGKRILNIGSGKGGNGMLFCPEIRVRSCWS